MGNIEGICFFYLSSFLVAVLIYVCFKSTTNVIPFKIAWTFRFAQKT